jgi:hypothetical protein
LLCRFLASAFERSLTPVDVSPVTNLENEHKQHVTGDFVDDAVITDAYA